MRKGKTVYRALKRAQDIFFSLLALIVLSPLLLIVAIAIVIDDPKGSPIFTQVRSGLDGKEFRIHKFRSMCVDAEAKLADLKLHTEMNGPIFKQKDDPRITHVGHFIVVAADCCTVASVIVSVPLPFAAAFAVGKLLRYLLSDESYTKIT